MVLLKFWKKGQARTTQCALMWGIVPLVRLFRLAIGPTVGRIVNGECSHVWNQDGASPHNENRLGLAPALLE
jgi:hypothetical protein